MESSSPRSSKTNISSVVTSSLRTLIEIIKKNVEVDEGVSYYQGFILSVIAILEDVLSTLERMLSFVIIFFYRVILNARKT